MGGEGRGGVSFATLKGTDGCMQRRVRVRVIRTISYLNAALKMKESVGLMRPPAPFSFSPGTSEAPAAMRLSTLNLPQEREWSTLFKVCISRSVSESVSESASESVSE